MSKKLITLLFLITNLLAFAIAKNINKNEANVSTQDLEASSVSERKSSLNAKEIIPKTNSSFISNKRNINKEFKVFFNSSDSFATSNLSSLANFQKRLENMSGDELKEFMDGLGEELYSDKINFDLKRLILLEWEKKNPQSLLEYI